MSQAQIEVDSVSKKFCRSLKRSLWYGVRDVGTELLGRRSDRSDLRRDEFWALRKVNFSLGRGETLGLIGHNGAGKTTILRLLSGLVKPDEGRISIRGRIQSLIALGAGFNPVLTGRENVYVNAAILGMSKTEISRRFDEIVSFSGIEEFIDMPVQSYSSGMTVRLGFSVAAHLEPDILLVDEVLAVGDLAFKTKCQVRIQEMRERGVSVILVSHSLHAISHLCPRTIVFEKGQVLFDGETEKAIDIYRGSLLQRQEDTGKILEAGTGEIKVHGLEILNDRGQRREEFGIGEYARLRVHYETSQPVDNPVFNITIHVLNGDQATGIRSDVDDFQTGVINGRGYFDIVVPEMNLLPDVYVVDAVVFHKDGFTFYDRVNKIGHFKITGGHRINGIAYLPHRYELRSSADVSVAGAVRHRQSGTGSL